VAAPEPGAAEAWAEPRPESAGGAGAETAALVMVVFWMSAHGDLLIVNGIRIRVIRSINDISLNV
jgi:hypothetical protein